MSNEEIDRTADRSFRWLERVAGILAILGVGGAGVFGYQAKEEGPTAGELMQEWDNKNTAEHHKIELEQQKAFFERADTMRRATDLERYQVESTEQLKKQQSDLLFLQQQTVELMEEIKE